MVNISIEDDRINFEVQGWDKVWTLRSQLSIPLAHITAVSVDADTARGWWHGWKLLGTQVPGLITAGTFYEHGGVVFYDVHNPERTIVLELDHERYERLIVEVDDPAAEAAKINAAIASASKS